MRAGRSEEATDGPPARHPAGTRTSSRGRKLICGKASASRKQGPARSAVRLVESSQVQVSASAPLPTTVTPCSSSNSRCTVSACAPSPSAKISRAWPPPRGSCVVVCFISRPLEMKTLLALKPRRRQRGPLACSGQGQGRLSGLRLPHAFRSAHGRARTVSLPRYPGRPIGLEGHADLGWTVPSGPSQSSSQRTAEGRKHRVGAPKGARAARQGGFPYKRGSLDREAWNGSRT